MPVPETGVAMQFQGSDGTSFDLQIVRYQLPELGNEPYDSNWLQIQIRVILARGSWSVTDPSLLTYEVRHLADWLDALDADESVNDEIGFIEPNLWFERLAAP